MITTTSLYPELGIVSPELRIILNFQVTLNIFSSTMLHLFANKSK